MRSVRLQGAWRERSLAADWSRGADWWWTRAVDAVSDILASRQGDARAACEALGRERADAGVFLDETRADVRVAARVACLDSEITTGLIDAATVGWVNRTLDRILATPSLDPLTELAPVAYLAARLHEVHAEAQLRGQSGEDTHALVVVRTQPSRDLILAETRMITIQTALRYAFRGGETLTRTGPTTAAALALRAPERLHDSLVALRSEVTLAVREVRLPPTRVWIEPVPHPDQLADLLSEING